MPPPAPSQPAAPQPPALLGRVFGSDAGMIWNPVKPDRTMDFEMVMARLKEALALSEDPVRKQQAAGWKVFRALEAGPNAIVQKNVVTITQIEKNASCGPGAP